MSHLVLTLRPGEMLIVNGARIRSRTRAQLELTTHARFLFGKQIMSAEAARTPARQFYLALQAAYAGSEVERAPGLEKARALAPTLKEAAASAVVCDAVDGALAAAEADDGYAAMKLARLLVRFESSLAQRAPMGTDLEAGAVAVEFLAANGSDPGARMRNG